MGERAAGLGAQEKADLPANTSCMSSPALLSNEHGICPSLRTFQSLFSPPEPRTGRAVLFIGVSCDHSTLRSDTARQEACFGETEKGSTSVSINVTLQASLSRLPKKRLTSCPNPQRQHCPVVRLEKLKASKTTSWYLWYCLSYIILSISRNYVFKTSCDL